MAPISWTSNGRIPSLRRATSRAAAKTSGSTSSRAAWSRLRSAFSRARRRSARRSRSGWLELVLGRGRSERACSATSARTVRHLGRGSARRSAPGSGSSSSLMRATMGRSLERWTSLPPPTRRARRLRMGRRSIGRRPRARSAAAGARGADASDRVGAAEIVRPTPCGVRGVSLYSAEAAGGPASGVVRRWRGSRAHAAASERGREREL